MTMEQFVWLGIVCFVGVWLVAPPPGARRRKR